MSKTIKEVLEKYIPCMCSFYDGFTYDKTKSCHCSVGKLNELALLEIQEIINECKPNHRHKFTLTSPKGYPEYSHRGWKIKHGWNAKGHMG